MYKKLKKLSNFLVENQEKEAYNNLYKLIKNSDEIEGVPDYSEIFLEDNTLRAIRSYAKDKDAFDDFIISENEFLHEHIPVKHLGSGGYGSAFLTTDGNVLKLFEGSKNIQEFYEEETNRLHSKDEGSKHTLKIIDHGTVKLPPKEFFDLKQVKLSWGNEAIIADGALMWAVMEYLTIKHDKLFSTYETKNTFTPILDEIREELYGMVESNTITQGKMEDASFRISNVFTIIMGQLNSTLTKRIESSKVTLKEVFSSDYIESLCEYVFNDVYTNYIKDNKFVSNLFNNKIIIKALSLMKKIVIEEILPGLSDKLRRIFYDEMRIIISKYFRAEKEELDGEIDLDLIKENIKSAIERIPMLKMYINALAIKSGQIDSLIDSILERLEQARVSDGKLRPDLHSGNIGYRGGDTPVFFDPFS